MARALSGAEIERILHHLPTILRSSESEWVRGFCASVLRQSRKPGWAPSSKQRVLLEGLIQDMFDGTGGALIDGGDA